LLARNDIGHVERHNGAEPVGLRTFPRGVVVGDGLGHRFGDSPQAQHERGQILMGRVKYFFLSLAERLALLLRLLAKRPEGLGVILHQNEAPQIMDQTGKESIVGGAIAKGFPAQFAGEPGRATTVPPEQFDRHFREVQPLVTLEYVHTENDGLDVPCSQLQERSLWIADGSLATKQRRIGGLDYAGQNAAVSPEQFGAPFEA
jgi:hypothetical protein